MIVAGPLLFAVLLLAPQAPPATAAATAPAIVAASDDPAERIARVTRGREALTGILAQRAFRRELDSSWQADLKKRATAWLADLWARTVGGRVAPRRLTAVVAWAAGLGAVAVLVIWLVRIASRRRAEALISVGPLAPPRLPGHVLGMQAAGLIRDGEIREGARVAYRAAVRRLEEEGALAPDAARTPREYLRLLPAGHRRTTTMAALTATFERIWYASRPVEPGEGAKILALLQDMGCLSFDRPR